MEAFWSHLSGVLQRFGQGLSDRWAYLTDWVQSNPGTAGDWFIGIVRWVMPLLALGILVTILHAMLQVKNPAESWGTLTDQTGRAYPIPHWECTLGRAKHCDVILPEEGTEATQCALIRSDKGQWTVHELSSKHDTLVNGKPLQKAQPARARLSALPLLRRVMKAAPAQEVSPISGGDTLSFSGVTLRFSPLSAEEAEAQRQRRQKESHFVSPWGALTVMTFFQALTAAELMINRSESWKMILFCFCLLALMMWGYFIVSAAGGSRGFEPELLAFFCCTLNLAVTASAIPAALFKETLSMAMGLVLFLVLGWYLRDLRRAVSIRYLMAAAAVGLLSLSLLFGFASHGAKNWISLAGVSFQPSELAKVCFIFAGSATLDRLFVRRNLVGFMLMSAACLGCLALMSDFGTAAIFFVCFLVIAFLRSGDFATLSLICGGVGGAGLLLLKFKPYIAARFAVWGHAWENASGSGYQQVRTMSAAASGGLIGVGAGNGWLKGVFAAETDLVFGLLCEEWGLIIALLAVACIVTLCVFSVRVTKNGRSAFYTTAACAATALLVFQTILNLFGSVDLLPLTGVTFPFVSTGGSSMMTAWGLLAFLKAADTRQGASFAVRGISRIFTHQPVDKPKGSSPETLSPHPLSGKPVPTDLSPEPEGRVSQEPDPTRAPAPPDEPADDCVVDSDVFDAIRRERGERK